MVLSPMLGGIYSFSYWTILFTGLSIDRWTSKERSITFCFISPSISSLRFSFTFLDVSINEKIEKISKPLEIMQKLFNLRSYFKKKKSIWLHRTGNIKQSLSFNLFPQPRFPSPSCINFPSCGFFAFLTQVHVLKKCI